MRAHGPSHRTEGTAQPAVPVALGRGRPRRITALVSAGAAQWGMWAARLKGHLEGPGPGADGGVASALVVTTAAQLPLAALAEYLGRDVLARLAVVRVTDRDDEPAAVAICQALERAAGQFVAVVVDSPCFEPPAEREMSRVARRGAEDVRRAMRAVADAGAHVYFTAPRVRGQWPPRDRDLVTAPRVAGLTGDVFRMGGGPLWQFAAEAIAYAEEDDAVCQGQPSGAE